LGANNAAMVDMGCRHGAGQGDYMIDDEQIPKPKTFNHLALDVLSVSNLRDYIGELQAEIARAEAAIAAKEGARGHADSFFKK